MGSSCVWTLGHARRLLRRGGARRCRVSRARRGTRELAGASDEFGHHRRWRDLRRASREGMAAYWQTAEEEPRIKDYMNAPAEARRVADADRIRPGTTAAPPRTSPARCGRSKARSEKPLYIFGSAELVCVAAARGGDRRVQAGGGAGDPRPRAAPVRRWRAGAAALRSAQPVTEGTVVLSYALAEPAELAFSPIFRRAPGVAFLQPRRAAAYLPEQGLRDAPPDAGVPTGGAERESEMNIEKFSERARGFMQAAQTIALRENHQRFLPEHLLKALLDDDQGLAPNLIRARRRRSRRRRKAAVDAAARQAAQGRGRRRPAVSWTPRPPRCWPRRRSSPTQAGRQLRDRRAAADRAGA